MTAAYIKIAIEVNLQTQGRAQVLFEDGTRNDYTIAEYQQAIANEEIDVNNADFITNADMLKEGMLFPDVLEDADSGEDESAVTITVEHDIRPFYKDLVRFGMLLALVAGACISVGLHHTTLAAVFAVLSVYMIFE